MPFIPDELLNGKNSFSARSWYSRWRLFPFFMKKAGSASGLYGVVKKTAGKRWSLLHKIATGFTSAQFLE